MTSFQIPELTIEMIETGKINREMYHGNQVHDLLIESGYTDLGWLNSGIKVPDNTTFECIYSNYTGSHCIYIDKFRRFYSVDMGD